MTRSTPFRFSPFKISLAILAAIALTLSPQALAQHAGGSAHASGGGGGHFAGGGGGGAHFSGGGRAAGFGTSGHSYAGSHVSSSPIHVFSGPRSAPIAAAPARADENSTASAVTNERASASAIQPRSSNISASSSDGLPRALAAFAQPRVSGEANFDAPRPAPLHTTIGFPPSTDPNVVSIAGAHRGAPLMIAGQGDHLWQTAPSNDAANRNSVRAIVGRPPQRAFPTPPHMRQRPPILAGPGLFFPPALVFSSPIFGLYGPGFGCDPSWIFPFQCSGLYPGAYGGYGYLGFGDGYGPYFSGFADSAYGYDAGYYAPPTFDVTPPNLDEGEGASQEPAPSDWQNPPAENSSPDNSASDNSSAQNAAPAPDTIIYLKDGTSFAVKDYWIADGQLHYITSYGGENAVALDVFDL